MQAWGCDMVTSMEDTEQTAVTGRSAIALLLVGRGLRDFGDGFVAVLLPLYLIMLGLSPFQVGVVASAALLGSSLLTLRLACLAQDMNAASSYSRRLV